MVVWSADRRAAFLLLAMLVATCSRTSSDGDLLEREMSAVTAWLTAGHVRFVSPPARSQTSWHKAASWSAESDLVWSKLLEGLKVRTPLGYDGCEARERSIVCGRRLSGDSIYIEVKHTADGPPLRLEVRVTVVAS
jgi:hypothetical protein